MLGIVPTDPYFIDKADAEHSGGNANFNLRSSLKDTNVRGLATATKLTRVATKFDKNFALKTEFKSDRIEIFGDYTMEGQILVLPIKGVGKTNVTLTNVTGIIELRGEYFDKNGETYIDITSFKFKLKPKHATFLFENIFRGDPVLSNTINNFMNENWELVANTLLPGYEARFGERFAVVANQIFKNVPMKMIFKE